jgi:hypothetical protein
MNDCILKSFLKNLETDLTCDSCHKAKPDVQYVIDPYQQAVYGVDVKRNLCADCYNACVGDI